MATQLYLDPSNIVSRGNWVPPGPVPRSIREFGFYPNVDDWLPGDLILVSNMSPNLSHHIIEQVQGLGYAPEHARWHHAAVYLTDGDICEANLTGVGLSSITRYVGSHLIRVRRDMDDNISPEMRWRIAMRSLTKLNQPYAFEYLLDIGLLAVSGFSKLSNKFSRLPKQAKICSQLYQDAYSPITRKVLQNERCGEITPAFLSHTSILEDVKVHWLTIE